MPKASQEGPGIGHNSDAAEAQVLAHMSVFRADRARIREAQEVVKSLKKVHKQHRNDAKGDGWYLNVLDEALDVEDVNDRETEKQAIQRRFLFEILALPLGVKNGELFSESDTAQDEAYWTQHGYNVGLRNGAAEAPDGMPTQFLQAWLKGRADGVERAAWSDAEKGKNPEKLGHGGGPTAAEIARNEAAAGGDSEDEDEELAGENKPLADPLLN